MMFGTSNIGKIGPSYIPLQKPQEKRVIRICSGARHAFYQTEDEEFYVLGETMKALGEKLILPDKFAGKKIVDFANGARHALFLLEDHLHLIGAGSNSEKQLGLTSVPLGVVEIELNIPDLKNGALISSIYVSPNLLLF